jgi:hypothetical protein
MKKQEMSKTEESVIKEKVFNNLIEDVVKLQNENASIDEIVDSIAKMGKFILEEFSSKSIRYDSESLKVLDSTINEHRSFFSSYIDNGEYFHVECFGAFIGKVLVNEFNMKWHVPSEEDGAVNILIEAIEIGNGLLLVPAQHVIKLIEDENYKIEEFAIDIERISKLVIPKELL